MTPGCRRVVVAAGLEIKFRQGSGAYGMAVVSPPPETAKTAAPLAAPAVVKEPGDTLVTAAPAAPEQNGVSLLPPKPLLNPISTAHYACQCWLMPHQAAELRCASLEHVLDDADAQFVTPKGAKLPIAGGEEIEYTPDESGNGSLSVQGQPKLKMQLFQDAPDPTTNPVTEPVTNPVADPATDPNTVANAFAAPAGPVMGKGVTADDVIMMPAQNSSGDVYHVLATVLNIPAYRRPTVACCYDTPDVKKIALTSAAFLGAFDGVTVMKLEVLSGNRPPARKRNGSNAIRKAKPMARRVIEQNATTPMFFCAAPGDTFEQLFLISPPRVTRPAPP